MIDHALDSAGLQSAAPEAAAWLSLVAYVRHVFTDYDDLLTQGYDRDSARHFVADEMAAMLCSGACAGRSVTDLIAQACARTPIAVAR